MATLHRRAVLAMGPAALAAGCEPGMRTTASVTPKLALEDLDRTVRKIQAEETGGGVLGVGLMNLENAETYAFNGDRRFPMQSVFKLPMGAAALSEVDARRLDLAEQVTLTEMQLSPQFSPIALAWPSRSAYTVGELLRATVVESDNTAADVLMKRIGGPGAVTAWLNGQRIPAIRIDRYERELQPEANGMPSFRPAWRTDDAFAAARSKVPADARLAARRAYMADPRDTATPLGMLTFLQRLDRGDLLSAASTRRLLEMMGQTARALGRLRAGLPKDAFLAHRPGTSGFDLGFSTAHNDVGIFSLGDKRSYAIAVFLSGSALDEAGRDAAIAHVAAAAAKAVG